MTLTKNKMIREIGRRTRLKNRDVQLMLEALMDVWAEELVSGGRIELENFLVMEVKEVYKTLFKNDTVGSGVYRTIFLKVSRQLRAKMKL